METTKKVRHTFDSIVLAICFCSAAMVCALLTAYGATADLSSPGTTAEDATTLNVFGITAGSTLTIIFILLACAALADGRRTINSPSDLESLMD